jgi:hypothetical protein
LSKEDEMGRTCKMKGVEEERRQEDKCRWLNNIKMDCREIGWVAMDWVWLRIATSGGLL